MALQQKSGFGKIRAPKATMPALAGSPSPPKGVSTYRVGKIATAQGQALCIVRTIFPNAVALDIEVPFKGAEDASLVIGRETLTGGLVMLGGKKAELRTIRTLDVEAILADPSLLAGAGRRTLPRLEVDARARLDVTGQNISARIRDISTDGIRVLVDDLLCVGDRVVVTIRGLETRLAGRVRWCDGDHAGIEFDQPLQIGRLNLWLAAHQSAPAAENPDWGLVSRS